MFSFLLSACRVKDELSEVSRAILMLEITGLSVSATADRVLLHLFLYMTVSSSL